MKRLISHTEISAALDCQAKHAFGYTGHLTGGQVLKPRATHINLRRGKAWGRGVAAFHQADPTLPLHARYAIALAELEASLDDDARRQTRHGFYDQTEHHDLAVYLATVLWHYVTTTEPMRVASLEFEMRTPIPSRSGRGISNRFFFHGFLDALSPTSGDRLLIVEYKLRDRLTDYAQVVLNRQYRRYAWAAERVLGKQIAGIVVDERLNEAPKPPRLVKGKKKTDPPYVPSHAKDQLTTPELYQALCEEFGIDPDADTHAALGQRRWQVRHPPVMFTRAEIEEAGRELVSAGHLIAQLDSGQLFPVRNPDPRRCPGCQFRDVCARPNDTELVDVNFERRPPKRDRPALEVLAA